MRSRWAAIVCASSVWLCASEGAASTAVQVPIECTRGPSGQIHRVSITTPAEVPSGGKFSVRIDGSSSGVIKHTGLNYIRDMTVEYLVPSGVTYVPGSLKLVPNTGTANVSSTARVVKVGNVLRLVMPGHVENGSSYTPPSFELELQAASPVGSKLPIRFSQYLVTANAIFVGDVDTTCTPKQSNTLGTTTVVAAPSP